MIVDEKYICYKQILNSTDILSSWSKEGIETRTLANSSTVKCLSDHLSTFAVVAENVTIDRDVIQTTPTTTRTPSTIIETTITSTEPPTSTTTSIDTPTTTSMDIVFYLCMDLYTFFY